MSYGKRNHQHKLHEVIRYFGFFPIGLLECIVCCDNAPSSQLSRPLNYTDLDIESVIKRSWESQWSLLHPCAAAIDRKKYRRREYICGNVC
eukprot:scaffold343769_cov19-Prasinocladus_malaysianus.AAC.1